MVKRSATWSYKSFYIQSIGFSYIVVDGRLDDMYVQLSC